MLAEQVILDLNNKFKEINTKIELENTELVKTIKNKEIVQIEIENLKKDIGNANIELEETNSKLNLEMAKIRTKEDRIIALKKEVLKIFILLSDPFYFISIF